MKIYVLLFMTTLLSCNEMDQRTEWGYRDQTIPKTAEPPSPSIEDMSFSLAFAEEANSSSHEKVLPEDMMIVKNGRMDIDVEQLSSSKQFVDSILRVNKGYYQNEEFHDRAGSIQYQLNLRIPNKTFDTVIKSLSSIVGKITDKSIDVRDITEEYVDLELRLANNERYVERYMKLLQRADSIADMIIIQDKIRRIEEEVEAKKGRINYLSNQVKYGTLQLNLIQYESELTASREDHLLAKLASAMISGYNNLLFFVLRIVAIWPLLLFIPLIYILVQRWRNHQGMKIPQKEM